MYWKYNYLEFDQSKIFKRYFDKILIFNYCICSILISLLIYLILLKIIYFRGIGLLEFLKLVGWSSDYCT